MMHSTSLLSEFNVCMGLNLSFCIDFIPFSIEFGVDDVSNCFFKAINYIHISKARGTKKIIHVYLKK